MNLGTAKRQALILMREWTLDGSVLPEYDNADYLKSAEDLASIAQMDIARRQKIAAHVTFQNPSDLEYGPFYIHTMPDDFLEARELYYLDGNRLILVVEDVFLWLDSKTLGLRGDLLEPFRLNYYRLPSAPAPDIEDLHANDNYEFEVDLETHYLIPFFMAAQMLMDEDRGLAQVKINEYYNRLMELEEKDYGGVMGRISNRMRW